MSTFKHKPSTHGPSTEIVHSKPVSAKGFSALPVPVYRGSSTFFENTAAQRATVNPIGLDYSYGLHGNPTQYTLAKKLAEIEGATHTLVCPSGLTAIALVAQACLKSGDHWLIPENVYGPVQALARSLHADYGVEFSEYDPCDVDTVASALQSNTKLVWTEAPGSLTFEVPDLQAIVSLAKAHGARTGIDNTWAAGIAYKPFEHGFDFSVQALTKYQCGHADVLMGAVLSNNTKAFADLERRNRILGLGVSPADCDLILRGLLTLPLRYQRQAESGLVVAKALKQHPAVARVLHPEFPECPGHAFYKRDFNGFASVFSVILNAEYTDEQACAIIDRLELFKIAYSWGGPESLGLVVNIPDSRKRHLADANGQCGPILRLAIGLEDSADLIADLMQALDAATESQHP
ncbi:PLP-dependent transferase [Limnobacter alexandrii]|jgi:cysteine-S-conjugate beta-lyase|uniref:PLP-dependent transferase n=1 Tax=Limnobacter alexandrii TaxID=2570352 RepID=UPI001109E095|nr:PLP-dependent transferase [Limnobacter alexandrii]